MEKEVEMKEMSGKISDEMLILKRVELFLTGDVAGVEQIAKKSSKARYSLKRFGKWEPRNSWQCDLCLLTGFDRDIQWKVCSFCQKSTHVFCQVQSEEELAASSDPFQCLACLGVTRRDQIGEKLVERISALNPLATNISVELAGLRKEESDFKQKCSKFMGTTRIRLQSILENDLKVNRSDYHSLCFVGNHCDKIVDKFEKITEVFSSEPDVKKKYDEFFEVYKKVHFLMKAKRFLTPEELDLLDFYCEQIGVIYPQELSEANSTKTR